MSRWSIVFLALAVASGVLGFGVLDAGAAALAQLGFFLFLVLFVITASAGLTRRDGPHA